MKHYVLYTERIGAYPEPSSEIVEDGNLQRKFFAAFDRVRQIQRHKEGLERCDLYTNVAHSTLSSVDTFQLI